MTGPDDRDQDQPGEEFDEFADLVEELDAWDQMFDSLHEEAPQGEPVSDAGEPSGPITSAPIGADLVVSESAPFEPSAAGDQDDDGIEFEIEIDSPTGESIRGPLVGEPTALGALLGVRTPAPEEADAAKATMTRTSPAIVRREDLERLRRQRTEGVEPDFDFGPGPSADYELDLDEDAAGDWDVAPVTSVMAKETVDRMVETAAAFFEEEDEEPEAEVSLELDGDFYDDIEIADAGGVVGAAVDTEGSRGTRRTMAHVVRRADSVVEEVPLPLQHGDDEVVVEIEAEPEDFHPGTGFDDEILSEALAASPDGAVLGPDVDLPSEAARALARSSRIDSIEKLRQALDLEQPAISGELIVEVPAEGARAIADGGLEPTSLPDVEMPPELPPRVLTRAVPGLDAVELALPESAADEPGDRTDARVARLEQAREAIERHASGPARGRLHLWAAELAAELGDLDELERHADAAVDDDPELAACAAALGRRRLARLGDWEALVAAYAGAATAAGDDSAEGAGFAEIAAELSAAMGQSEVVGDRSGDGDVNHRWRAMLSAVSGSPEALDRAAPALAEAIADAPMRAALMRLWLRRRGPDVWNEALEIAPSIAGDLIAWELAAHRGPSARAAAAQQLAERLEEQALAPALVDSLRIVAGEALRATGDSGGAREVLAEVAGRQAAHPVLARVLLGVLGPDDRETAGYLLAAVSGTALAPEAARALRRWAESDTGASRAERLHRALALSPGDPLVLADLETADAEADPASSEEALEVSIGLALAPRVSGDPVAVLDRARDRLGAGDAEGALAELARGELPRGALLVAGEILDAAVAVGPAAVVTAWREIAGASDACRALLARRVVLAEIDRAIAERDDEPDLSVALGALAELAPSDRIAARAVLAETLAGARGGLSSIIDEATGWPGLDPAGLALERVELELGDEPLSEAVAETALSLIDDLDDHRTGWLAIAALGRSGDWQRAADRIAIDTAPAATYRAAYMLLEHADDPAAAESRLAEVADANPELSPLADLLDAARRKLGGGVELARPGRVRRRSSDPWTATIVGAELAQRSGDLKKSIDIYKRALTERPGDPIAIEGLEWVAHAALDAAPLAERALAALRAAEEEGDTAGQTEAYATLARIDTEIRGDPASALLAWESCADLDPSDPEALRALERAYLATDRHRELLLLYGRLLASAEGDREIAALLALRARSAEMVGRDIADVLGDYRQIIELDELDRMALFRLEAAAHTGPPNPERADLERRVARLLASDPRSAAAFLCRAGETIASLGDHVRAIERFVEALSIHQGHVPSIRGWRHAALASGDWAALAEATEAEAAIASDSGRVELLHLAGVAWMDKAADGERARQALAAVLALAPLHEDAFARMRLLCDEVGDDEALGDLLRQLLESSPPSDVALAAHLELAALCRNFWEDREGAVRHLEAALELAPANQKAISEMSDILWELGRWDAASDALIRRARLESDPAVLKHIFYRLGTIYADHLPDSTWAQRCFRKVLTYDPTDIPTLERMAMLSADGGDHKTALAAYERLLKLETSDDEKVDYLHRTAQIQEVVLQQPAAAERALRIAFDLAPHSHTALGRLVDFYTRAGDSTSIRVHLDRAAQAMRARLVDDPLDPAPYVVIARVLRTRENAGVSGSLAVAQAAAELAQALGSEEREAAEIAGTRAPGRPRLEPLAAPEIDEPLIPRVIPAGLRVVFSALRSRLPKSIGADVKRFGVGRGDRLRRGKHPVANLAHEMADELGIGNVDVYVSSAVADKAMVVPTSPPSIILGARFASLDRGAELAFALGRCLKLAQMGLAVVDTMTPAELDLLVGGIVRQFAPDFLAFNLDDATLTAEQHRLRRLIPGGLASELRPHALALTGVLLEPEMLHAALRLCGLRAGLIASGHAAAALAAGLRHGGYSTSREASRDPDITGLLRFAVSEEHVEIQSLLASR